MGKCGRTKMLAICLATKIFVYGIQEPPFQWSGSGLCDYSVRQKPHTFQCTQFCVRYIGTYVNEASQVIVTYQELGELLPYPGMFGAQMGFQTSLT